MRTYLVLPLGMFVCAGLLLAGCGDDSAADDEVTTSETGDGDGDPSGDGDGDPSGDGDGECSADTTGPSVTSSLDPLSLGLGETSLSYTLTFDEPVTLAAGALTVDNGATLSTPTLPAEGTEFELTLDGVDDGQVYTLSLAADAITDTCGNPLAADASLEVVGECTLDVTPIALTSAEYYQLDEWTAETMVTLEFDEPVLLDANNLTVSNGAVITEVTPALPATSASFTVAVSGLVDIHGLAVADIADECGNLSSETVWLCSGNEVVFDFTGEEQTFVVPACAQGEVTLEVFGAQGVAGSGYIPTFGGRGGRAQGNLAVDAGDTLFVRVGGFNGYNGGGPGGSGNANASGNGGGASDVRHNNNTLADRVIVGGGGGGGGGDGQDDCPGAAAGGGGNGGYSAGNTGSSTLDPCYSFISSGGFGGSQDSGGAGGLGTWNCNIMAGPGDAGELGAGGAGGNGSDCNGGNFGAGGGGGGGGYYGGGGGGGGPGSGSPFTWPGAGGGGGSSYIGGVTDGTTTNGVKNDNGQVIIRW